MARMRYKKNPSARTRRRAYLSMFMWGVRHGRKGSYKPRQNRLFGN